MEFVIGSKKGQLPVLFQVTKYMERNFLFFCDASCDHFESINPKTERGFRVFPEITFVDLCKAFVVINT